MLSAVRLGFDREEDMDLPLTKTMDSGDYSSLLPQLVVVEEHFHKASAQADQRKWEYGMALLGLSQWLALGRKSDFWGLDVGGAGSPFHFMVEPLGFNMAIVDPKVNWTLHEAVGGGDTYSFVSCISVLEHIPLPELPQFIEDLAQVTAPGGLLFLTMDCWDQPPSAPDTAHFSNMRTHIYTLTSWKVLAQTFWDFGFDLFEEQDWEYHGHQLYGSYSFASLALVKRA
jgi:hypothetical protein